LTLPFFHLFLQFQTPIIFWNVIIFIFKIRYEP
jgi:hypothetical protein